MQDYPPGTVKFTKAKFSVLYADRSDSPDERERLRNRWRSDLTPPAWIPERWYVAQTFRYWTDGEGNGKYFDIPGGEPIVDEAIEDELSPLVFDGASVPWPLTILVPKTHPIYLGASALHDYLYSRRHQEIRRREADDLFLDALLISGLNWWWAGAMWRAVRAAGWAVWYKRKPDTLVGQFLNRAHWIVRVPVVLVVTAFTGLGGILTDPFLGGRRVYQRDRVIRARE